MNDRPAQAPRSQPRLPRAVRPRSRTARAWRYPAAAVALAALAGVCVAGCGAAGAGHSNSGSAGSGLASAPSTGSSPGGAASSPAGTSGSGGTAAAGQGAAASASRASLLCARRGAVTRLIVVRPAAPGRRPVLRFPFPGKLATKSAVGAQAVAAAVCALPRMPRVMRCPAALLGTTYELTFAMAGRALPPVSVSATGCETVTGAGPVRTAGAALGFWRVLGAAIGLYRAGLAVFAGQGPTVHQCQARTAGRGVLNGCPGVTGPAAPGHGSAPVPVS